MDSEIPGQAPENPIKLIFKFGPPIWPRVYSQRGMFVQKISDLDRLLFLRYSLPRCKNCDVLARVEKINFQIWPSNLAQRLLPERYVCTENFRPVSPIVFEIFAPQGAKIVMS